MEEHPKRKNVRLQNYDYSSNGYYFITICAKNRQVFYNNQCIIKETFFSLPDRFGGLSIDYSVFMDDHIHAILILECSGAKLGEIIRQFKAAATYKAKVKDLWQRGYYEHIIRNEKALYKIREYIQNNPLAEKLHFEQLYV